MKLFGFLAVALTLCAGAAFADTDGSARNRGTRQTVQVTTDEQTSHSCRAEKKQCCSANKAQNKDKSGDAQHGCGKHKK